MDRSIPAMLLLAALAAPVVPLPATAHAAEAVPAPVAVAANPAAASPADEAVIRVGGQAFATWRDYLDSDAFVTKGLRCQAPARDAAQSFAAPAAASDCSYSSTNPSGAYAPAEVYTIPVVFHVLQHANGNGFVSSALIASQIEILNEDFRALAGTPGSPGVDTKIEFVLATEDPSGNPTTGITSSTNSTWYNDGGSYWNTLAWDTTRYLNVYTNTAGGALGYVPGLPQTGVAGSKSDRVVLLWSAVGRDAPIGPPYDQGRTATHEFGHFLGLFHTFDGGCGSASACYTSGDLVCDTNRESTAHFGCSSSSTCSSSDPIHNYMDYTDDTCMWTFTEEQARRMRCSIQNYRGTLFSSGPDPWQDLGLGLAGLLGTPTLSGAGTLAAGDPVTLSFAHAMPFGAAFLVLGLARVDAPFKGGTLVPSPDVIVSGIPLDGTGGFEATFSMPPGAPPGLQTYWQVWTLDGSAPKGFAASGGLLGTTP